MFLGIEVGGTKLQLGVGPGNGAPLLALERRSVRAEQGADGILDAIREAGRQLLAAHPCDAIGVGFGGPLDSVRGRILKSHHVAGWDDFPLAEWIQRELDRPAFVQNDADTAGLAEATCGAGRGLDPVLYVTVGTGIGGGLIHRGEIYRGCGLGAVELGHLRPGLGSRSPVQNVEALAAGWGIAAQAQAHLRSWTANRFDTPDPDAEDLLARCNGQIPRLTTQTLGLAANAGNRLAREIFAHAITALSWTLAQTITLLAPQVVVVGGGVSLLGEDLFWEPLRRGVADYVFPPFAEQYQLVPAALGEEVVIHGALAVAQQGLSRGPR